MIGWVELKLKVIGTDVCRIYMGEYKNGAFGELMGLENRGGVREVWTMRKSSENKGFLEKKGERDGECCGLERIRW